MMQLTIHNDYTGRRTTVDTSKRLTPNRVRDIRNRLCLPFETHADILGAYGRQQDGYEAFKRRAERVLATKKPEPRSSLA